MRAVTKSESIKFLETSRIVRSFTTRNALHWGDVLQVWRLWVRFLMMSLV